MTVMLGGRVLTGDADLPDASVVVDGDRIVDVVEGDGEMSARDTVIVPGLVDAHCHGGGGASFTVADPDEVRRAAAHHLAQGTTSLVGSVVTDARGPMLAAIAVLADAVDDGVLAAIHVEGPFLSLAQCGAQDPAHLVAPDLDLTRELLDAGRGHVRVMTIAPELAGAGAVAALLAERGVTPAVGHTEADARTTAEFLAATDPGLVTHLFNGMPSLHHRDPGPVAGALAAAARRQAYVELIGDGVHLADETAATMLALLEDRVLLVSDSMAAAGMPDGDYRVGPQEVRVVDGVARLVHGDSIAGGTSRLLDQVRRHIGAGLDPAMVVAAASRVPAEALGLAEVGALRPGLRADLVVLDASLRPLRVMRAGEWVA